MVKLSQHLKLSGTGKRQAKLCTLNTESGETASPFLECFDNVTDVLLLNVSADTKVHL